MTTAGVLSSASGSDRSRWAGVALGGGVLLAAVAGTYLAVVPGDRGFGALLDDNVLTSTVEAVVLGTIAATLMWMRPGNRVAWVLLYAAAANALTILGEGWALASFHVPLPGREAMAWLASWVWGTALALGATVLPAVYPTGHAETRAARTILRLGWVAAGAVGAGLALLDDAWRSAVPGHAMGDNPISRGHAQDVVVAWLAVAGIGSIALVLVTTGWTLRRLRRAASPEREQLAWLVASVLPSITVVFVAPPGISFVVNVLASLGLLAGIVRYQLFDIKLVLRRGLVYGALLALAVGGYLAAVTGITLVTPSGTVPHLFAAAVVALLLVPAYRWLTTAAERLVYGDRADPLRALSRVHDGRDTGTGLAAMVAAVAESVRSPHVVVRDSEGVLLAESGHAPGGQRHVVELRHGDADLGVLDVATRTRHDRFSRRDRRLIEALAAPVAAAVGASRLAAEAADSRARVVAVREAERRSLRNDLHDGLGPGLSGVALGIEAALRAGDEDRMREILGVVHAEVGGLVGEVRGIIDDLGPDGLVDRGLLGALRTHAASLTALTGLEVSVTGTEAPDLPRPVELALYRIAAEALTNVVRHAAAGCATVTLQAGRGTVRLEVTDDGVGVGSAAAGVGRASMAERAHSLGGSLAVTDAPGGGTTVTAVVPTTAARRHR